MYIYVYIYIYIYIERERDVYMYIYIHIYIHVYGMRTCICVRVRTHGSFLIRRQRGHPGVVLQLVIHNSAKSLGRNAIRIEPNWKGAQLEMNPIGNEPWAMCT